MEEQTVDLGRRLVRYYGDGVGLEYIDVFSLRMGEFPWVQRAIDRLNIPLPIVAFNGEPRIAGGISIEKISQELEKRGLVPLEAPPE